MEHFHFSSKLTFIYQNVSLVSALTCSFKADSHIACRAHAVPMLFPCHVMPLIHKLHTAPLPCSDSAVSFVKVLMAAGNIRTASRTVQQNVFFFVVCSTTLFLVHDKHCLVSHWPPVPEIGMLLITTFVELRVVARRSWTQAVRPHAISRRTCCAVALRRTARHGRGLASVNQTRPHCVNQMGMTHFKHLAARHGRGMACVRHGHGMLSVNRPLGGRRKDRNQAPHVLRPVLRSVRIYQCIDESQTLCYSETSVSYDCFPVGTAQQSNISLCFPFHYSNCYSHDNESCDRFTFGKFWVQISVRRQILTTENFHESPRLL